MNVKRYFAQTAREALRQLKEELGADAIVLSNRSVDGGVEIVALPADAVDLLHQSTRAAPPAAKAPVARPQAAAAPVMRHDPLDDMIDDDYRVQLSSARRSPAPAAQAPRAPAPAPTHQQIRPFQPPRIDTAAPQRTADVFPRGGQTPASPRQEAPARRPAAPAAAPRDDESARIRALQETNARLMEEMGGIRAMLERQLAGFAWGEAGRQAPARTRMTGELLEAGFSAQLARTLCDAVDPNAELAAARNAVKTALNRGLRALSNDADVIDRGGVYALVGPTGVGKTTTAAKLAARCVVRHGADKLALITTDGYRIGAHEQLRIYGRILGVPVYVVRDAADLRQTLAELRDKHMVLIDTVGMSQRDRMVAEQAAMLTGAGNVNRLLLLNATCRGDTLDDVVRAYDGPDLAGCILTKVDEAASLAPALDVAVRHEMAVYYVANGQRVPEDLHLPNRAYLLHRALKAVGEESPYHLKGEEAGLLMASAGMGA
ncbi:flagellar biosynthesis protein FlhF [Denitromonas iodatirespirans]|uniref:Flagellar biosynthesis protein FlhF n=1 Tax=Denitromonas iodatirespirans TaxID=2795389 RepID=A0A944D7V6_DENI1|nr:flagellar biosynthesis protein FlhF [Denitromonas iodatirespirans]MBT0959638.1 flagellar biosynthesis protein FlhF [Denitromonas iodatirespirans]